MLSVRDFFEAFAAANLSRVRMVEYPGKGVLLIQVKRSEIERVRGLLRGQTAVGIAVVVDALPWCWCWWRRFQLHTVVYDPF